MNSEPKWWLRLQVQQPKLPAAADDPLARELSQEDETTRKWIGRYVHLADFLLSTEEPEDLEIDESSAA